MSRRIIDLWYDVENRVLVSEEGTSQEAANTPSLSFKENAILRIRLVKFDINTGAYAAYTALGASDSFSLVIDDDYDYSTTPWVKSNAPLFNIAGDWTSGGTANPANGELSVRVDLNTSTLENALGTESAIAGICEIQTRPAGEIYLSGVYAFPINLYNLLENVDWVQLTINTQYNPTAVNASTLDMNADLTASILDDAALKIMWGDTYYYGIADTVASGSIGIYGLSVATGASALQEVWYERMPSVIAANYLTTAETYALIAGKINIVNSATAGDIPILNASGGLADSTRSFVDSISEVAPSTGSIPSEYAIMAYASGFLGLNGSSASGNLPRFGSAGLLEDTGKIFVNTINSAVPSNLKVPSELAIVDYASGLVQASGNYLINLIAASGSVSGAVSGNIPVFDTGGVLKDSGKTFIGTVNNVSPTDLRIPTEQALVAYMSATGNTNVWQTWENDDMDTGLEILTSFAAPDYPTTWKMFGYLEKAASGMIAFESLIGLRVIDDGYGGYTKSIGMTVQHTNEIGNASGIEWASGASGEYLYSDYDSGSDTVRVRASFPSNNWRGKGKYIWGE